jgi:hypothetical protein
LFILYDRNEELYPNPLNYCFLVDAFLSVDFVFKTILN